MRRVDEHLLGSDHVPAEPQVDFRRDDSTDRIEGFLIAALLRLVEFLSMRFDRQRSVGIEEYVSQRQFAEQRPLLFRKSGCCRCRRERRQCLGREIGHVLLVESEGSEKRLVKTLLDELDLLLAAFRRGIEWRPVPRTKAASRLTGP